MTAPPASAAVRLQIFDGATLVADRTSAGPSITFRGTSANYTLVMETGSTNRPGDPIFGGSLTSTLDVRRNTTAGTQTLTVLLTATDYINTPGSPLPLNSTAGGSFLNTTAGDTATFQSFADPTNTDAGTPVPPATTTGLQTAIASQGVPGVSQAAAFNPADPSVQFDRTGAYALTHRITITLSAGASFAGGETTGTHVRPHSVIH